MKMIEREKKGNRDTDEKREIKEQGTQMKKKVPRGGQRRTEKKVTSEEKKGTTSNINNITGKLAR